MNFIARRKIALICFTCTHQKYNSSYISMSFILLFICLSLKNGDGGAVVVLQGPDNNAKEACGQKKENHKCFLICRKLVAIKKKGKWEKLAQDIILASIKHTIFVPFRKGL